MNHVPVLLQEVIDYLNVEPDKKYIDATVGMGGHARAIMDAGGVVLGIDRDPSIIESLRASAKQSQRDRFGLRPRDDRLILVAGSFADMKELARANGFEKVSGILFDLGMGSHQLDDSNRGFAFQTEGPLDMRYDQEEGQKVRTAGVVINHWSERDLVKTFKEFGEERKFAKRIAKAVLATRKEKEIETTTELFELIKRALPAKIRFRSRDVARRIFQSLRIAVNQELEFIEKALPQTVDLLEPGGPASTRGGEPKRGGRLVVISFHSLEDRIVKNFFAKEAKDCVCPPEVPVCRCDKEATLRILTPKPITASEKEAMNNPRSKSAKLRAAERL